MAMSWIWTLMVGAAVLCGLALGNGPTGAKGALDGAAAGADLILIETISDLLEAKAALLAAKERTNLPVFVTMTFGADGRTFLGVDPAAATVTLTSLGADAVGVNCSAGPRELRPVLEEVLCHTHLPVMIQPNAGLPRLEDSETVYDVAPEEFAHWAALFLEDGASILGGCCGTTPDHIRALRALLDCRGGGGGPPGERMNPTGCPVMKKALYAKDWEAAAEAAVWQEREGADFLVVNAGLPDIDEGEALPALVLAIQKVSPLPLVIDCSDPAALEKALRVCRGRPVLNSVNGGKESMASMLPLAAKYGTGLIVLALDAGGISSQPEARRDTALRVAGAAERAGVHREDIWIDCLALAASVSQKDALVTPEAIRLVRQAGYKTVLGVSNVSYGLPGRDELNCAYLSACLAAGLNVAIVNTESSCVRETLSAMKVLTGQDPGCMRYITRHQIVGGPDHPVHLPQESLELLIAGGIKAGVPAAVEALLEAGALDVSYVPLQMKKHRPGALLLCLCRPAEAHRLAREILRLTSTFGVRRTDCPRYALAVTRDEVETPLGTVARKTGTGWGIVKSKPEYADLAAIAREKGVSLAEVRRSYEGAQ